MSIAGKFLPKMYSFRDDECRLLQVLFEKQTSQKEHKKVSENRFMGKNSAAAGKLNYTLGSQDKSKFFVPRQICSIFTGGHSCTVQAVGYIHQLYP